MYQSHVIRECLSINTSAFTHSLNTTSGRASALRRLSADSRRTSKESHIGSTFFTRPQSLAGR